jgi:hypothetical protein
MAEIHGRQDLCSPVTLSSEQAPSPIRACSQPHPPGSGRLRSAHGRRTADCRSDRRPGRHPTATPHDRHPTATPHDRHPTATPHDRLRSITADLKRE